ncbi:MAG: fibrobacter succinogenes major paralogous domain-containing protein, partial [bacterium]
MNTSAKDVIVGLTGFCGGKEHSLDTIVVENLTHPDTLVFVALPQTVTTYLINLSTGNLINGISPPSAGNIIKLEVNTPGFSKILMELKKPEMFRFELFTITGQRLIEQSLSLGTDQHAIDILTGTGAWFLLAITGNKLHTTFRLCGATGQDQRPGINLNGSFPAVKSGNIPQVLDSPGFIFFPGDEVRFIAKKQGYYENSVRTLPQDGDSLSVILSKPCPGFPVVFDADGNVYPTVLIGNQCWMRENMKATHYANGAPLVDGTGLGSWNGDNTKYWFDPDDDPNLAQIYGKLYSGSAATNGPSQAWGDSTRIQGICPYGWHLPDDAEWRTMEMFLGMDSSVALSFYFRGTNEGNQLKEADEYHWWIPWGNNYSGFTALGSGIKYDDGSFDYLTALAGFWTSSA